MEHRHKDRQTEREGREGGTQTDIKTHRQERGEVEHKDRQTREKGER